MLQLSEPWHTRADNAWGRTILTRNNHYQVEQKDVGRHLNNFGGYGRPGLTLRQQHVGQKLIHAEYEGWNSWYWDTRP